jgi:DNA-binding response OmpR family regulator
MDDQISIIVVDDDQRMGAALQRNLTKVGYQVTLASSGQALRQAYRRTQADLVLLDLNLGSEDGIDIARELVATTSVAVIIITGRIDVQDRIEGLDAGADDYLVKPFAIEELLARIRAVLRRRAIENAPMGDLECGPFRLDLTTQTFYRDDASVPGLSLTATEARMFGVLLRQPNRAVSRERLSNRGPQDPGDRSIDVHVGNLRRKLREAGIDELVISPVRGFGYRLQYQAGADRPPQPED